MGDRLRAVPALRPASALAAPEFALSVKFPRESLGVEHHGGGVGIQERGTHTKYADAKISLLRCGEKLSRTGYLEEN